MAYDLYPAVDSNLLFPPAVRAANAASAEFRSQVVPMTTTARNNLTAPELWDGRVIANITTDRLERYDAGTTTWSPLAEASELTVLNNALQKQLGLRNKIRNGDQSIAQRGNGPWATNGVYGIDGHKISVGNAVISMSRGIFTAANQSVRYDCVASMTTPAVGAGDYAMVTLPIEDVRTLAGKQCTLSLRGVVNVAGRVVGVSVRQIFGTGGAASGVQDTPIGVLSPPINTAGIDTPAAYLTLTFTMPSILAKTIGSNEDSYVELRLWLGVGATNLAISGFQNAAQGTQAAFGFSFTEIQLEEGSVASPFERLPTAFQLLWNQRYFHRQQSNASSIPLGAGLASTTSGGIASVTYPVPMRAIPTLVVTNPASFAVYVGPGSFVALTALSAFSFGPVSSMLSWATASAVASAGGVVLLCHNVSNGNLDFSAEF